MQFSKQEILEKMRILKLIACLAAAPYYYVVNSESSFDGALNVRLYKECYYKSNIKNQIVFCGFELTVLPLTLPRRSMEESHFLG